MEISGLNSASSILYMGMLGMFTLALIIVGLVLVYKKRILQEQLRLQQQQIAHQQQLLQKGIEIQDEERKRFAADLHDEIGGGISTVMLYVSQLAQKTDDMRLMPIELEKIRLQLNRLLNSSRNISYSIMPKALEDFGLKAALSNLCLQIDEASAAHCYLAWHGELDRLAFHVELGLYRIIKEVLTNALKHAQAQNISVDIRNQEARLDICIEDDGIGFNTSEEYIGVGLKNIYDRALILGVAIALSSSLKEGTSYNMHYQKPTVV